MSKETKTTQKQLKYSVLAKIVNLNPAKFGAKIIIVNGTPAIKVKEKVYVKIR